MVEKGSTKGRKTGTTLSSTIGQVQKKAGIQMAFLAILTSIDTIMLLMQGTRHDTESRCYL